MTTHTPERRRSAGAPILLALAFAAAILVVPHLAGAAAPTALNFNPQTFHGTVTDLGLDAVGRYAAVGIQETQTDVVLNKPEIAVVDLDAPSLAWSGIGGGFTQSNPAVHVAAAPGKATDANGAPRFAVGGSEGYVSAFSRAGNLQWTCNRANSQVSDLAYTQSGDYLLASFTSPTATGPHAHLGAIVLYPPSIKSSKDCSLAGNASFFRPANVVAVPSGALPDKTFHQYYFAVGTEDQLRVYFSPDLASGLGQSWSPSTIDGPVTSMQFSSDGHDLVVGTSRPPGSVGGTMYFLSLDGNGSLYRSYSWRFSQAVTSVAISADGKIMAAGTAGGEVKFFRNIDTATVHAADPGPSFHTPNGASISGLSIDGSGQYIVASAGKRVFGFYADTGKSLWNVSLPATVSGLSISQNAAHVAVTAGAQLYGYHLQQALGVSAPHSHRSAAPLQTLTYPVTLANTGSEVGNYSVVLQYPSGWQQVTSDTAPVILPGRNLTIPVQVTVPNDTAPGTYPTQVRVFSQVDQHLVDTAYLNTTVQAVQNIRIRAPSHDLRVSAGVQDQYAFTVQNTGNSIAYLNFTIQPRSSTGNPWNLTVLNYQTEPKVVAIQVPRNGQKVVNLAVTAPASAVDGDYNRVTVLVQAGNDTHVVTKSLSFTARVNPSFAIDANLDKTNLNFTAGQSRAVELRLVNSGNSIDTVNLTASVSPASLHQDWAVVIPQDVRLNNITLGRGASRTVVVTLHPTGSTIKQATVTLHVNSTGGVRKSLAISVGPTTQSGGKVPLPSAGFLVAALGAAALLVGRWRRETGR